MWLFFGKLRLSKIANKKFLARVLDVTNPFYLSKLKTWDYCILAQMSEVFDEMTA